MSSPSLFLSMRCLVLGGIFFCVFSFFFLRLFSFSLPVFIYNIGAFVFVPFPASRFFRPSIPLRFFALHFRFAYLRVRFPLAGWRCSCRRLGASFLPRVARSGFRRSPFPGFAKKIAKNFGKNLEVSGKRPTFAPLFRNTGRRGFRKEPVSTRSDH